MKITVLGLWHLGTVTAACCAAHFPVMGLDFGAENIARLNSGHAPLLEPGLNDLLAAGLATKRLSFTTDPATALAGSEILWLCYDTPVNENDESDTEYVLGNLRRSAGTGQFGELLSCFYCLSLWIAAPFAWLLADGWRHRLLLWPALSAGAILLERIASGGEPAAPIVLEEPEDPNVLRS